MLFHSIKQYLMILTTSFFQFYSLTSECCLISYFDARKFWCIFVLAILKTNPFSHHLYKCNFMNFMYKCNFVKISLCTDVPSRRGRLYTGYVKMRAASLQFARTHARFTHCARTSLGASRGKIQISHFSLLRCMCFAYSRHESTHGE